MRARRAVGLALILLAPLAAACGQGRGSVTPRVPPQALSPAASGGAAQPPSGQGTPAHQATPAPAPIRFIVTPGGPGVRWRAPVLPGGSASVRALTQVAQAIRAATPVGGVPHAPSCGPLGQMLATPPPTSASWWELGLAAGGVVKVAPDVIPCAPGAAGPGSTPNPTNPEYALIGGQVARAPGLVGQLSALTAKQPYVDALAASPPRAAPGASIRVTGYGWVGPEVTLTLDWSVVGKPGIGERQLARVAVGSGGQIGWTGRLPADLPAGATDLSLNAGDGVRANALQLQAP